MAYNMTSINPKQWDALVEASGGGEGGTTTPTAISNLANDIVTGDADIVAQLTDIAAAIREGGSGDTPTASDVEYDPDGRIYISEDNVQGAIDDVDDELIQLNQNLTNLEYGASYGGANIWNEKWVLGGLTWAGGAEYTASDRIRSTDYTPVKSNTSYYATTITQLALFFYDSSKAFISYKTDLTSNTFTTPSNAKYIKLVIQSTTSYANNLAIIEGTSGTYVPYIPSVKQINDSLTWKLVGKVTGQTSLALPSNYNEILVVMYTDEYFTFAIPKVLLDATNVKIFRSGAYYGTSTNYGCAIYAKTTSVMPMSYYKNGSSLISTVAMEVYYR